MFSLRATKTGQRHAYPGEGGEGPSALTLLPSEPAPTPLPRCDAVTSEGEGCGYDIVLRMPSDGFECENGQLTAHAGGALSLL